MVQLLTLFLVGDSCSSPLQVKGEHMLSILFLSELIPQASAVSPRWSFVEAYQYIDGGSWYRGEDNSEALLAWGESYVMSALASMSRTTGSPEWLDQLAWHADAVLEQRDDNRGVMDYRGKVKPAGKTSTIKVDWSLLLWYTQEC